jgi:hypothetical protein
LALSSIRTQLREHNNGRSSRNKVTEWFENFRERFR